ncbi:hypothetical protein C3Y87_13250 [Carbonactinospora thermoautotrophica]|nr:hypothetical protein [Carbonactinospora thermoautotrophica]
MRTIRSTGGRGRSRRLTDTMRRYCSPWTSHLPLVPRHGLHIIRGPEAFEVVNEHFVPAKADRKERSDVGAVLMQARQAMTGRGGWPMTCFLTPVGELFSCGTYFPATPPTGLPSFSQVLNTVATAGRDQCDEDQCDEVRQGGARIVEQLTRQRREPAARLVARRLNAAVARLRTDHDTARHGFGPAPKYPPSMVLGFPLRHATRSGHGLDLVTHACEAMARGQLRPAWRWLRPLCDRRELGSPIPREEAFRQRAPLRVYTRWWRPGPVLARRVALRAAEWMLRRARGFASALRFPGDPDDPARAEDIRLRLVEGRRDRRRPPRRDGKVVSAWNGLAMAGLTQAGLIFGPPDLSVGRRQGSAELLLRVHLAERRSWRSSRGRRIGDTMDVLEDYGGVVVGPAVRSGQHAGLARPPAPLTTPHPAGGKRKILRLRINCKLGLNCKLGPAGLPGGWACHLGAGPWPGTG